MNIGMVQSTIGVCDASLDNPWHRDFVTVVVTGKSRSTPWVCLLLLKQRFSLQETALTLYWKNGIVATTDGPYAETKEQLVGIGILEALNMNHAERLMAQHPSLKYGSVFEIRPAADKNEIIKAREQRQRQNTARKSSPPLLIQRKTSNSNRH